MPVALVSWDSQNKTLHELCSVVDKFDRVYVEANESANQLLNTISETVECASTMYITDLSSDDLASESFQRLFEKFSEIKTGNILIISHQSFFQSAGHTVNEWQPLSLQGF